MLDTDENPGDATSGVFSAVFMVSSMAFLENLL